MSDTTVNTSLEGLFRSIKKSKYSLAPIYEAITNSFEAILAKEYLENETPEIKILFEFKNLLPDEKTLDFIKITDNGIGFTNENYDRFKKALDNSKGYNNRGSGRFQFLHRFSEIHINSYYQEDVHFKRKFKFNATQFVYLHQNEPDNENHPSGSEITFFPGNKLDKDHKYYDNLEKEDVIRDLKKHFLLRFYLDSKKEIIKAPEIKIIFSKNNKEYSNYTIKPSEMPKPIKDDAFSVPYLKLKDPKSYTLEWEKVPNKKETIYWGHFKLSKDDLDQNSIFLCSKGVSVEALQFGSLTQKDHIDGNRYLTAFWGKAFDLEANINHAVDEFTFPDKKEIENSIKEGDLFLPDQEFLFFNTIKGEINKILPEVYKEITDLKADQDELIEKLAEEHGISLEIAKKAKIKFSDSEQQIIAKIYKAESEDHSRKNQKIRKIFNQLNELNPISDDYRKDLEEKCTELLSLIPEQNKEELSRYIIRREMVVDVLKKILNQNLEYQKEKTQNNERQEREALIHDLIFKRKNLKSTAQNNDLWILNEEYLHFDGCSEIQLKKLEYGKGKKLLRNIPQEKIKEFNIILTQTPDVFLFPCEEKCVIIEFKQPEADITKHLNQMTSYCQIIGTYSVPKLTRFYCYLIGENFNINSLDGSYKETVSGDWLKSDIQLVSADGKRDPIGTAQLEIIKLSTIANRAHRRNKSFADKLGLREAQNNITS